jgi:hypothetical protein
LIPALTERQHRRDRQRAKRRCPRPATSGTLRHHGQGSSSPDLNVSRPSMASRTPSRRADHASVRRGHREVPQGRDQAVLIARPRRVRLRAP